MKNLIAPLVLSLLATTVAAESLLIKGADIYTAKAVLPATDLYIDNGRITAIGNTAPSTADRIIDGNGKSISPGLFNADTHLGVVEVGAIDATVDFYS